ncbi:MAG: hypothetical protein WHS87_07475 [Anaerolineales bacterium]
MDYGEILTRSWRYLWRYKILWLFGILNGCQTFSANISEDNSAAQQQAMAMLERWASEPIVTLALAVFVLSFIFAIFILSLIGSIGTIRTVFLAEEGREPGWQEIFANGWSAFWRLFGFYILLGMLIFIFVAVLTGISVFTVVNLADGSEEDIGLAVLGLILICTCALLPLFLLIASLTITIRAALVLEPEGFWGAFRKGWQVYIRHLGKWILLTIILFVIRLFLVVPISVPLALLTVPLALQFPILIFGFLFLGGLNAFTDSVFTIAYLRLRPNPEVAGEAEYGRLAL